VSNKEKPERDDYSPSSVFRIKSDEQNNTRLIRYPVQFKI